MNARDKAALLIQQAQEKGRADFEQWKEGYLSEKLNGEAGQEARVFLREKYKSLVQWYWANNEPKGLFDVMHTPQPKLASAWASCFVDWEGGFIPLPGITPEFDYEAFDIEGNALGPYIPASWLLPLAERFKIAYILQFIDSALNDRLEVWQRNKFNQIAFAAKLAIQFALKAGALPEAAILEALEKAQTEEGKAGALPEEAIQQLAQELLELCKGARSEDELTYLQKRIDNAIRRKPQQQEANTKIWALYYWYLREAGLKPELHSGSGKKAALEALAREHGISAQNLFQVFNAVGRNSDKNPLKVDILGKVIPMLSGYPEALERAKRDLDKLQKNSKE